MDWKAVLSSIAGLTGIWLQSVLVWISWHWFIASQFPVPELTYLQALGIAVFALVVRRLIDIPVEAYELTSEERLEKGFKMLCALVDIFIIITVFKVAFFL